MNSEHIDLLLGKLRAGTCSPEELEELKEIVEGEDKNLLEVYLDEELKEEKTDNFPKVGQEVWNNVKSQIQFRPEKASNAKLRRMVFRWLSAAAAIGLLFLLGYQWNDSIKGRDVIWVENTNEEQEIKVVTLPDSSKVWLNKGGKLSYTPAFDKKERNVTLDGHAFFEVERDEKRPFNVVTGDLRVTVLGTSFDVKSFNDKEESEVALFTGSVKVNSLANREEWILKPSEQLLYRVGGQNLIEAFDPDLLAIWRKEEFSFNEVSIDKIIKMLKVHFGKISVELENPNWLKEEISWTFRKSDKLKDILELICFNKDWQLKELDQNKYLITK